jgi:hypothetical protein
MADSAQSQPSPAEQAYARLVEYPSDYVETAHELAHEARMNEMEAWANGIGAHTERIAAWHHKIGQQALESARQGNDNSADKIQAALKHAPMNRTGVRVDRDGKVAIHSHYPYSGDTPAGGWASYRSPKNIRSQQ